MARTVQRDSGVHRRNLCTVQFFIKDDRGFIHTIAFENGEGSVAHDAQKPRPTVFATKTFEKSKRAQSGLLHNVFRVPIVAQEKARQIVSRVEMRQDLPLELGQASAFGQLEHASLLSIIRIKTPGT